MPENFLVTFLLMVMVGVGFEVIILKTYYLLTKQTLKKHHFSYSRYLFFLFFPVISLLLLSFYTTLSVIKIFLLFCVAGPALEWGIGYSYQQILGQRLWTYYRLPLGGYTSLLAVPLWGFAGALFWFIAKEL